MSRFDCSPYGMVGPNICVWVSPALQGSVVSSYQLVCQWMTMLQYFKNMLVYTTRIAAGASQVWLKKSYMDECHQYC